MDAQDSEGKGNGPNEESQDDGVRTFKIKRKISPSTQMGPDASEVTSKQLEDQVEVHPEYIRFLSGSWVKAVNKETNQYNSGGFLAKVEEGRAFLRTPKSKDLVEIIVKSHYFYCKSTSEQYKAVQEITLGYEKLKHDRYVFEQEQKKKNEILRRMYFSRNGP